MSHFISHSEAVIADGQTVQTGSVDSIGYLVSGIIIPAGFEGTTLTFQACDTATGTFLDVVNSSGTAVSMTVAASTHVVFEPQTFAGARYLKVVAGTAQTGATTLKLVMHREE